MTVCMTMACAIWNRVIFIPEIRIAKLSVLLLEFFFTLNFKSRFYGMKLDSGTGGIPLKCQII